MNRNVKSVTVKLGQSADVIGRGKFFKILSTTPAAYVLVQAGENYDAVAGIEIPFENSVSGLKVSCPGAAVDVTLQYYLGDFPFKENLKVAPAGSITTTDWFNIAAAGQAQILGIFSLNGTAYRRKSILLVNMSGIAGKAAAVLGLASTTNTARTSIKQSAGVITYNAGFTPLMPSDGTRIFPVPLETDDTIYLQNNALTGPGDYSITQIWIPILP